VCSPRRFLLSCTSLRTSQDLNREPGRFAGSRTTGREEREDIDFDRTEERMTMAAALVLEEERGTYVTTPRHPHNGYYAGDFSVTSPRPNGFETALISATRSGSRSAAA